jgi:UDP-galactopyranose mutase
MISVTTDVLCFSHLRWGFVFQRPQHLLRRFAQAGRVFYWEEPIFEDTEAHLRSSVCSITGVNVVTPILPEHLDASQIVHLQQKLLHELVQQQRLVDYVAWYYTPMAVEFTKTIKPAVTVYDCMDELSAFAGAPVEMRENEQRLFATADLIFTGGATLFQSKKSQHEAVYLFPSSIDFEHFAQARSTHSEPEDQAAIPHPRLGYSGVIDERMDLTLLREIAAARPDWQIVLLGPVVKIDAASLPQANNIHYLGMKKYADLPRYLAGWDVALLPFAHNESTKFISPTKTPEYLAAGLPVVSSSIRDVVQPYGERTFVRIADGSHAFIQQIEETLRAPSTDEHRSRVDAFLAASSWDKTWSEMNGLIRSVLERKRDAMDSTHGANAVDGGSIYV